MDPNVESGVALDLLRERRAISTQGRTVNRQPNSPTPIHSPRFIAFLTREYQPAVLIAFSTDPPAM